MDAFETYEHHGITVELHYDEDQEHAHPRGDCNVTTLFCSYPGYNLGDEQLPSGGFDDIECPRCEGSGEVAEDQDCTRCEGMGSCTPTLKEWANEQDAIAIAPLFVYEHSGITIRAGAVKCLPEGELTRRDTQSKGQFMGDDAGWDTSMVGFAIITEDDWTEMMGDTPRTEEKFREVIDSEVGVYAAYLEGQVYGYVVAEGQLGDDSCWGFVGDPDESGLKEEANHAAEHAAQLQQVEKNERSEMAARDILTVAA